MSRGREADGPDEGGTRTPDRLRRRASRLLSQLAVRTDQLVSDGLSRADARKWHYAVLASLQDHGPGSQAALSRRTGIYRSDMVGVLNELVERGLVERAPDADDRRRNIISLSAAGSRHLRTLDRILDEVHDELLAPLSATERDAFVRLLTRLLDHHAGGPSARTPSDRP